MGSLSRKLHKTTGGQKRTVYPAPHLLYYREETRKFLDEMRKTHHRDEYARVSQAFIAALGKKYGLPEGWYE